MKHAFLIIAHNNWWQLRNLIQLLDYKTHDIYVHIDKKAKDYDAKNFCNITEYSKVSIFQEYKVYWGGYSQVLVEMFLFEKALLGDYDYYHLISGSDLPLKSNAELDEFFEKNNGREFISYDFVKLENDPEIKRRTKLFHFLQNYRRRFHYRFFNGLFTFMERVLLLLQIICRVNRIKNLDWKIYYGSNWVSITKELVSKILFYKEKIKKIFSYTNCADELFIQTIAMNCGFEDRIAEQQNMRFIDWEYGMNGNPYTFNINDYSRIINSNCLFARKFSESVDKEIIDRISLQIRGID